jgi:predicted RNA-binding protein YlqC (UPF0109 family)
MEKDQNFVEMVVKEIVDNPDKVVTERKVDEMGVLIELTVDPADMGKIIGKEGKTAKAIRTLLRVLGAKEHARVNLKIIEPETGREVASNGEEAQEIQESPVAEEAPREIAQTEDSEDGVTPLEESTTDVI